MSKKKKGKKGKAVKKRKVKPKKKGRKKSLPQEIKAHSLLSEALKDIEAELERMRIEKTETEKQLKRYAESIEDTQEQEIELKSRISGLQNREDQLAVKRGRLMEKIVRLKQKIEKVTQIGAEMQEVG